MWEQQNMHNSNAVHLLNFIVRTVFAAEPSQISLLFFLQYLRSGGGYNALSDILGGAQQERIKGGTQAVSLAMAKELGPRIVLNAPVTKIVQWEGGVIVHSEVGIFRGKHAIVAISPMLAGNIHYIPPMPPMRDHLTQRVPMGCAIKVYILYKEAFWRQAGWSGEVLSTDGPLCLYYDATNYKGQPALVGFVVAAATADWSGKEQSSEFREAVINQIVSLFGEEGRNPQHLIAKEWGTDRFARGCYGGVLNTGVLSVFGPAMSAPVGRVHWAGTETATEWMGYMEGALQSGARAAKEIIQQQHDTAQSAPPPAPGSVARL
eukprot:TRINITY_DN3448_c0_g1_i1.p1 TRINITY_DN3448_c0_g1~~TRINITY_DN3448_c0_g1_i1.p1  ORF type:complete len:320 (+),score=56.26 TRINITY_DN3448_c0_g1_i1:635-1594(+)